MTDSARRCTVLFLLLGVLLLVIGGVIGTPAGAVEDGDVENVIVYRLSSLGDMDREAFLADLENGSIAPAERVVIGDTLVVPIESDRLADSLGSGNDSHTARFLDTIETNATLRIEQTNPSPQRQPKLARLGPENISVSTNGSTTYVFVNTSTLQFGPEGNPDAGVSDIYGGERFAVLFGYDMAANPDMSEYEGVPVVEFHPSRATFYDNAWYDPLPPERVDLPLLVHVPPTQSLTVRVSLPENRTITTSGPIEETGLDDVPVNLRDVDPGTAYELELLYDGSVIDRYTGTVREPNATLSNVRLTTIGNQAAVKLTANLSHGGGVVALDQHCQNYGLEYVDPGTDQPMAIALYDRDGTMIPAAEIDRLPVVVRSLRGETATTPVYNDTGSYATFNTNVTCDRGTDTDSTVHQTTTSRRTPATSDPTSTADSTTSSRAPTTTGGGTQDTTTTVPGFTVPLGILGILAGLGIARRGR